MILMYHKVFPESPTMWWVNPDAFWRQLEALQRYKVVYLDQYDTRNPKQAVITFDGVYENVFTFAFPILKKFGYPFELFVVGDTVGKGNEFDQPLEPPARFATKEQLRKMVQEGGRLQWHSRTHKDLTKTNQLSLVKEELTVPAEFQEMDPKGFRWFAYPHGKHNPQIIALTKASFSGALSCEAGNDWDRFQLNRVTAVNDTRFKGSTVSVIIPNYNYGHLLPEAVESVLHQTVPADEILFIDDCSQDNSLAVAERYKGKIKIVKNATNLGIIANFNKAVSLTQGDYISFLGADNRFRSDYIEKCKLALDTHPDCAIAYTNALLFGPMAEVFAQRFGARPLLNSHEFFLWEFPVFSDEAKQNLRRKNIIHGSSMYRREAFGQVGGYRESHGPEDQNLFARILERGWNAILCRDYLLEYRHHSNQQDCARRISAMEVAHLRRQVKEKDALIQQLALMVQKYKKMSGDRGKHALLGPSSQAANFQGRLDPLAGKPKAIAFYLPQFHPIPENDVWWGKGFTEWMNVAKAKPLFPGHYQPHVPGDLGFYDLRLPEARIAQAEMAREHGIYGFCYYHYWFRGKLLLERPIQEVIKTGTPDFPFCLCWANEDWTRSWDGRSRDVLAKQEYDQEDDRRHIRYLIPIFKDPRYIRVKGKPLFLVYRPSKLPEAKKTLTLWREEARRSGIGELYLCQVERFPEDTGEPSRLGFDAAVEFQPDGVNLGPPLSDRQYGANSVFLYKDLVRAALSKSNPEYRRFPCVTPSWDNSPRKDKNAVIFIEGTPALYEEWLRRIVERQTDCEDEENLIFINAMNEWGEGCHLEPDLRFGRSYLEATKRAIGVEQEKRLSALQKKGKVQPSVSIIIPIFNKVEFTQRCVAALRKTISEDVGEIIIVNNGSTDDTKAYLGSLQGEVKVIENYRNRGFAAACNQGAKIAAHPFLLFLNNDTEPFPGWVEPLVRVLNKDSSVGAAGGKLLFPEGLIQHAGVVIINDRKIKDPLVARHLYYRQPSDLPEANQIRTYQALTAACLLVRRSSFEEVGGFDEKYWNGYEDIDLGFKLQEKGWKLVYHPQSVLIHHESISGPERFSKTPENISLLHQKWLGKIKPDLVIEESGEAKKTGTSGIKPYQIPEDGLPRETIRAKAAEKGMVSLIILTFNQIEFTRQCLQSIRRHTPEKHEIIFVDNGSMDGTTKWLRKQTRGNPLCRLIENKTNLGFAKGCNQGMAEARGEYLLLLNNDVVVTPEWLSGMLECLYSHPGIGIVGPMTNEISGIQKIVEATYQPGEKPDEFALKFRERNRNRLIPSRRIVGFCMLFHRELIEKVGLLDESFGTGNFEDDDFCLRAELEGYTNMIAGDVFIHHYGSRSFVGNQIDYRSSMNGNRKIFFAKWNGIDWNSPAGRRLLSRKEMEAAWESYYQDHLEESAQKFLQALKISPHDENIYLAFAQMLLDAKKYQESLDLLNQIPKGEKGEKPDALRGYCLEGLGKIEEAEEFAEKSLSARPDNALALNLTGVLAYRKGQKEGAVAAFEKAIQTDPGYGEPFTNLGVMKWEGGEKEAGLTLLERGFILSPTGTDTLQLYHAAVCATGALERAEEIFSSAEALYPAHKKIQYLLMDILLRQGKNEAAMERIEKAIAGLGMDEGMISAALEVRKRIGVKEVSRANGRKTISLCMIVKNEEKYLAKCLQSIRKAVDEIIVVDTGSTDKTKELAAIFGAKVFDFAWEEDFSSARNYSLAQASGDWILVLDADERISESDHPLLRKMVEGPNGVGKAFSFVTRNYVNRPELVGFTPNEGSYPEEEGAGWTPSEKARLFPNDRRFLFENPVHEMIGPALERHRVVIQKCPVPVHHYGKLDSEREKEKGERYYSLGRKKLELKPDVSSLKELAIQAGGVGRFEEAISLWNRILALDPKMADAYINLSYNHLKQQNFEEAARLSRRARELDPNSKEALLNYASAEFFNGNMERVIQSLEDSLPGCSEYPPILGLLSLAYVLEGKPEKGLPLSEKLKKMGFNYSEYISRSADDLIGAGQEQRAKSLLHWVAKNRKGEGAPAGMIVG